MRLNRCCAKPVDRCVTEPEVVGFKRDGCHGRRHHRHRDFGAESGADCCARHAFVANSVESTSGLDNLRRRTAHHCQQGPELRANLCFLPDDDETLRYLRQTGRDEDRVALVEAYARENGFWRGADYAPVYTSTLELDMGSVVPAISGPKRPQDHTPLDQAAAKFLDVVSEYRGVAATTEAAEMADEGPAPTAPADPRKSATVTGEDYTLRDGSVVIASITSCTNTSNPYVMIGAGLVARKARALGLTRKPWVKTSLAPRLSGRLCLSGSRRSARRSGRHRLQPCGLWLHHLHRQFRPAARGNLEGDQRQ